MVCNLIDDDVDEDEDDDDDDDRWSNRWDRDLKSKAADSNSITKPACAQEKGFNSRAVGQGQTCQFAC